MATKKRTKKRVKGLRARSPAAAKGGADEGMEALRLIGAALSRHEDAVMQLAEVIVNVHANVRALREVVEALAEGATDRRVLAATKRLGRVKLEE